MSAPKKELEVHAEELPPAAAPTSSTSDDMRVNKDTAAVNSDAGASATVPDTSASKDTCVNSDTSTSCETSLQDGASAPGASSSNDMRVSNDTPPPLSSHASHTADTSVTSPSSDITEHNAISVQGVTSASATSLSSDIGVTNDTSPEGGASASDSSSSNGMSASNVFPSLPNLNADYLRILGSPRSKSAASRPSAIASEAAASSSDGSASAGVRAKAHRRLPSIGASQLHRDFVPPPLDAPSPRVRIPPPRHTVGTDSATGGEDSASSVSSTRTCDDVKSASSSSESVLNVTGENPPRASPVPFLNPEFLRILASSSASSSPTSRGGRKHRRLPSVDAPRRPTGDIDAPPSEEPFARVPPPKSAPLPTRSKTTSELMSPVAAPLLNPDFLPALGSPQSASGTSSGPSLPSKPPRRKKKHRRLPSIDPSETHRNFVAPPEADPSPRAPPKSPVAPHISSSSPVSPPARVPSLNPEYLRVLASTPDPFVPRIRTPKRILTSPGASPVHRSHTPPLPGGEASPRTRTPPKSPAYKTNLPAERPPRHASTVPVLDPAFLRILGTPRKQRVSRSPTPSPSKRHHRRVPSIGASGTHRNFVPPPGEAPLPSPRPPPKLRSRRNSEEKSPSPVPSLNPEYLRILATPRNAVDDTSSRRKHRRLPSVAASETHRNFVPPPKGDPSPSPRLPPKLSPGTNSEEKSTLVSPVPELNTDFLRILGTPRNSNEQSHISDITDVSSSKRHRRVPSIGASGVHRNFVPPPIDDPSPSPRPPPKLSPALVSSVPELNADFLRILGTPRNSSQHSHISDIFDVSSSKRHRRVPSIGASGVHRNFVPPPEGNPSPSPRPPPKLSPGANSEEKPTLFSSVPELNADFLRILGTPRNSSQHSHISDSSDVSSSKRHRRVPSIGASGVHRNFVPPPEGNPSPSPRPPPKLSPGTNSEEKSAHVSSVPEFNSDFLRILGTPRNFEKHPRSTSSDNTDASSSKRHRRVPSIGASVTHRNFVPPPTDDPSPRPPPRETSGDGKYDPPLDTSEPPSGVTPTPVVRNPSIGTAELHQNSSPPSDAGPTPLAADTKSAAESKSNVLPEAKRASSSTFTFDNVKHLEVSSSIDGVPSVGGVANPSDGESKSPPSTSESEVPASAGTAVPALHTEYLRILGSPRGKSSTSLAGSTSQERPRRKHRRLPSVDPSDAHRSFVPPPESEPSPRRPPKSPKSSDGGPSATSVTKSAQSKSELESKPSNSSAAPPHASYRETKSRLSTSEPEDTAADVDASSDAPMTSSASPMASSRTSLEKAAASPHLAGGPTADGAASSGRSASTSVDKKSQDTQQAASPASARHTEEDAPTNRENVSSALTEGSLSASKKEKVPDERVSPASRGAAQRLDAAHATNVAEAAATNSDQGGEEKRATNVVTSQALRVRVVSFNMHGQTGKVGDFRRMLRGEDIVCLQEVDDIEGTKAQYIEDYPHVYTSTNNTSFTNAWTLVQKLWRFRRTSIMVLSKFPLEVCDDEIIQTDPGGDNWQRNAQHVIVRLPSSVSRCVESVKAGQERHGGSSPAPLEGQGGGNCTTTGGQDAGNAANETISSANVSSEEVEDGGSACLHLFHYHNTYNWHKESSASESAGVEKFLEWVTNRLSVFADNESPLQYVLAGDFNLTCGPGKQGGNTGAVPLMTRTLCRLREEGVHVSNNWVDYVCSPLPMVSSGVYRTRQCGVSDHDAVWAEFSART